MAESDARPARSVRLEELESWLVDDPLSPFIGDEVVSKHEADQHLAALQAEHDAVIEERDRQTTYALASLAAVQRERDRAETAEAERDQWRTWAQFVYLGGGSPEGTNHDLQARVCARHDQDVLEVRAERDALQQQLVRWQRSAPNPETVDLWAAQWRETKARADQLADLTRRGQQLAQQWKDRGLLLCPKISERELNTRDLTRSERVERPMGALLLECADELLNLFAADPPACKNR